MDSVFILILGLTWFGFWTYLDGEESLKTRSRGGHEWNPFARGLTDHKFIPVLYWIFNAMFFVLSIVAYMNRWGVGTDPSVAANWQPAFTLGVLGCGHIFGFFTNQSKVKQLEWRAAHPALPGEVRPPL